MFTSATIGVLAGVCAIAGSVSLWIASEIPKSQRDFYNLGSVDEAFRSLRTFAIIGALLSCGGGILTTWFLGRVSNPVAVLALLLTLSIPVAVWISKVCWAGLKRRRSSRQLASMPSPKTDDELKTAAAVAALHTALYPREFKPEHALQDPFPSGEKPGEWLVR